MHHIPVFVDKTLLWALSIWYAVFAFWGVAAFYFGIRTIDITAGDSFGAWYALAICLVSAILLPLPIFPDNEKHVAERVEKYVTIAWLAIVSLYPISLAYQTIVNYDDTRAQLTVLSLAYLVFPIWRFTFLFRKHRTHVAE